MLGCSLAQRTRRAWSLIIVAIACEGVFPHTVRGQGVDFKSLCTIHTVTSGPYDHNHAYPTARTWSRTHDAIFIDSPGPDARGRVYKNIRHLISVNIESGKTHWLASSVHPDPDHAPGPFQFDYASDANCLVFTGPKQQTIRMLNLSTGVERVVLEEPAGQIEGPLSVAWDGTRIAYWVMMPMTANRFFDDYITVIFAIDVDAKTCRATGEPRIVEAYPRRKGPNWSEENSRDGVHVNHCQINPRNRDHLTFAHEMLGSHPDGSVARSRLWHSMMDERRKEVLIHQPAGLHFTHEVIAPDGRSLIFPYMHGVGQVFFDTLERRSIYYNKDCCPGHLTISPDGRWIVGDTWGQWKHEGRTWQSLMMFDVATRRYAHICWFNHSHPHPIFSQDGRRVAFSHRDDEGYQQIAWIDVSDIQTRWDEIALGPAEEASPPWIEGVDAKPWKRDERWK